MFPQALMESDAVQTLSPIQVGNFSARLEHVAEIVSEIESWHANGAERAGLAEFLDELELDVAACQDLNLSQPDQRVSAWVVHSSWTADVVGGALLDSLASDLRDEIEAPLPHVESQQSSINAWLSRQADVIREVLQGLSAAGSYSMAIALLIALDVLLAKMLTGLYKLRLSRSLRVAV